MTTQTTTAADLRQHLQNADEALQALQGQRDLVQAAMQEHENAVGALKQSASERKAYIADIRDSIATFARDLRGMQATAVITRDTPSERTTTATIADLTERKTTCETSLQTYIAEDAAALATEQQEETEHEQAYGVLTAQRDTLEAQQAELQVQRDEIFTALGAAEFQEGTALMERLETALLRQEADVEQGKVLVQLSCEQWKQSLWAWPTLLRQARESYPDQRPETAIDRVKRAYLNLLDTLERDGQTLPQSVDGTFLQRELSLSEGAIAYYIKPDAEPMDRRNSFSHTRSRITDLLNKVNSRR